MSIEDGNKSQDSFNEEAILILTNPALESSTSLSTSTSILPSSSTSLSSSPLPQSISTSSCSSVSSFSFVKPSTKKPTKATKSSDLSRFVDSIKPAEQKEIDNAIASFFYGCNIPLHNIESPHFKEMVKKLRPSYANLIPKRKMLSTQLLDEAYEKCLKEIRSSDLCDSVLLIDGWKNTSSNSKTIVSMMHNAKGKRAFLNAWDLSGEAETADRISDIVYESIDLGKEMYNTSFYAVVSDNASVMTKMGRNVAHVLWHSRCNSHIGNLLAKDVADKGLVEKVNTILREFKNTDFEKAIVSKGGKRIKLACETRWCSFRDTFGNFLFNLQHMKQIITDGRPKKVKTAVSKLVFDDELIESVKENKEMLDPICGLINKCQEMDANLADAAYMWLSFDVKDKFKI